VAGASTRVSQLCARVGHASACLEQLCAHWVRASARLGQLNARLDKPGPRSCAALLGACALASGDHDGALSASVAVFELLEGGDSLLQPVSSAEGRLELAGLHELLDRQ
jgi:hypothetical protein